MDGATLGKLSYFKVLRYFLLSVILQSLRGHSSTNDAKFVAVDGVVT